MLKEMWIKLRRDASNKIRYLVFFDWRIKYGKGGGLHTGSLQSLENVSRFEQIYLHSMPEAPCVLMCSLFIFFRMS